MRGDSACLWNFKMSIWVVFRGIEEDTQWSSWQQGFVETQWLAGIFSFICVLRIQLPNSPAVLFVFLDAAWNASCGRGATYCRIFSKTVVISLVDQMSRRGKLFRMMNLIFCPWAQAHPGAVGMAHGGAHDPPSQLRHPRRRHHRSSPNTQFSYDCCSVEIFQIIGLSSVLYTMSWAKKILCAKLF